jgi:hypothetical protein
MELEVALLTDDPAAVADAVARELGIGTADVTVESWRRGTGAERLNVAQHGHVHLTRLR